MPRATSTVRLQNWDFQGLPGKGLPFQGLTQARTELLSGTWGGSPVLKELSNNHPHHTERMEELKVISRQQHLARPVKAAQRQLGVHPEGRELPEVSPARPTSAVPHGCPPCPGFAQPVLAAAGAGDPLCHTAAAARAALGHCWAGQSRAGARVQPHITALFPACLAGTDKLGSEEAPRGTAAGTVQNKEIWGRAFQGQGCRCFPHLEAANPGEQLPPGSSLVSGTPLELSGVN